MNRNIFRIIIRCNKIAQQFVQGYDFEKKNTEINAKHKENCVLFFLVENKTSNNSNNKTYRSSFIVFVKLK